MLSYRVTRLNIFYNKLVRYVFNEYWYWYHKLLRNIVKERDRVHKKVTHLFAINSLEGVTRRNELEEGIILKMQQ